MGNQKVVIFGGPDRCGKTTIAKELSKVIDVPYFKPTNQRHFAMNDPNVFELQTRWGETKLIDFLNQTGHSAILDRSFVCDYAYSKVLGRNTAWAVIDALDEAYAEIDALLVLTLRKSYAGRADDEWKVIDEEKLKRLDEAYRHYAMATKMRYLILETDDEDLTTQIRDIMVYL
jgi:thymidylate kinase